MAKISYVGNFVKHFSKRIEPHPNLRQKFDERIKLFLANPNNPTLKDHPLKGNKIGLRSFSITGGILELFIIQKKILCILLILALIIRFTKH